MKTTLGAGTTGPVLITLLCGIDAAEDNAQVTIYIYLMTIKFYLQSEEFLELYNEPLLIYISDPGSQDFLNTTPMNNV